MPERDVNFQHRASLHCSGNIFSSFISFYYTEPAHDKADDRDCALSLMFSQSLTFAMS